MVACCLFPFESLKLGAALLNLAPVRPGIATRFIDSLALRESPERVSAEADGSPVPYRASFAAGGDHRNGRGDFKRHLPCNRQAHSRPADHARQTGMIPISHRVQPSFIEPMKARLVEHAPPGDWLYEIKLDGFRTLLERRGFGSPA